MTPRATCMTNTLRSSGLAASVAPSSQSADAAADPVSAAAFASGRSSAAKDPAAGVAARAKAPAASFGNGKDFAAVDPRGADGTIQCWTVRGCAGIWGPTGDYMEDSCPHNIPDRYSPCPSTCAYTRCQRPWHREAVTLDDLLDPDVDRMQAIKEECRHCLYFIKRGPRAGADAGTGSAS